MMTYLLLLASVLLGALVVLILKPSKKTVRLLLAFSGAYLLSVAILHLLPEVYNGSSDNNIMGICILAGVILQSVLESFSKGAEHGHIHIHTNGRTFPRLLFVSLCVHAFSEGLPIYHSGDNLLWAIIVHKIPIAIILTIFLVNSNFSKKTIGIFLTVFALMSPLGVLLSDKFMFFELHPDYAFMLDNLETFSIRFLASMFENYLNVDGLNLENLQLVNKQLKNK